MTPIRSPTATRSPGPPQSLSRARLSVVRGAHHDVLNDLQHRAVAAEVVTFLEALRNEPSLDPILQVESNGWWPR